VVAVIAQHSSCGAQFSRDFPGRPPAILGRHKSAVRFPRLDAVPPAGET